MSISYFKNPPSRMICYYGNTNDAFVDESLFPLNIRQVLFHELKKSGYERILFYAGNGVTFLDKTSKELWNGRKVEQQEAAKMPEFLAKFSNSDAAGLAAEELAPITINDTDMLREIDNKLKEAKIKTAVIIENGSQTLCEFAKDGNERLLAELLKSVVQYEHGKIDNDNLLIFLFDQFGSEAGAGDIPIFLSDRNKAWAQYLSPKAHVAVSHILGMPNAAEIRAMLNYLRLYGADEKKKLRIAMEELPEISHMLSIRLLNNLNAGDKDWLSGDESFNQTMLQDLMKYLHGYFIEKDRLLDKEACEMVCRRKGTIPALERVNQLIGMQPVKDYVKRFAKINEHAPKPPEPAPSRLSVQKDSIASQKGKAKLHLALTGNPGTGKTTVAELLGEIYYELGFLPSGHTIKVTRDDLVAGYMGQTAMKTKACIERAIGGVLFIDEAYMLKRSDTQDNDNFGQEAIDTIMEAMSSREGQFAVVAAGYREEMQIFLESNRGFWRRFHDNMIHIEDYSADEQQKIFMHFCEKNNYAIAEDLQEALPHFMESWFRSRDKKWGNAGEVETFVSQLYSSWCKRDGDENEEGMPALTVADVPKRLRVHLETIEDAKRDAMEELNSLVGLNGVKERVRDLRLEKEMEGSSEPGNYIFAGNPGTGKTTVARLMGDILCSAGALRRGHLVEARREDLVGGYAGHTALKTRKVIESAIDGVLFIDEAYSLNEGAGSDYNFGREAINTLTAAVEEYRGRLCVICAGYVEEMEKFRNSNPGLCSRFEDTIIFEDYSPDEMVQVVKRFAASEEKAYVLSEAFLACSRKVFEVWTEEKAPGFGNARDVREYFKECRRRMRRRLYDKYHGELEDIPEGEKHLLTDWDIPEREKCLLEKLHN